MAINAMPVIVQYRYYGTGNSNNNPANLSWIDGSSSGTEDPVDLLSGLGPAVKIGIQTLPGVKFYLNNNSHGIIINHTGVYELDLRDITTTISNLRFDVESLNLIDQIDNASIIVDIMYKPVDGTVTSS